MLHERFAKSITAIFAAGALFLTCLLCACGHTHNPRFVEAAAATCSQNGNIAYWACDCGKNFYDEAAKYPVNDFDIVVQSKQHDFSDYGYNDKTHYRKCSRCGYINEGTETDHILKYSADGNGHHRYCYCGYETPQEPHKSDDGEGFCSVCRYRRPKYELSKDGKYYIVSGASQPFKDSVRELEIPDTYLGLPVKEIGERAFDGAVLERVTLGANIITVGDYAFKDCASLTEINFNEKLLEVSSHAFYNCAKLESVEFNSKLKFMGNSLFQGCVSLKSVTVPQGVKEILNNTFYECAALDKVVLHDGITSIETAAFSQSGIKEFTFPPEITAVPQTAFYRCPNLKSVTVPATVKSIGAGAFMDCPSLETIYFLGTRAQWDKIEFGNVWNLKSDFAVVCLG